MQNVSYAIGMGFELLLTLGAVSIMVGVVAGRAALVFEVVAGRTRRARRQSGGMFVRSASFQVLAFALGALGALAACRAKPAPELQVDASTAVTPVTPASRESPRASADDASSAERRVVERWSLALDTHDVDALESLYAERVRFYGREVSKSEVLAAKRRALSSAPSFRQSILGPIALEAVEGGIRATFTKHSGIAPRVRDVKAFLTLEHDDKGVRILEESDEPTAKRSADVREKTCEDAASKAVDGLPEVQRERASMMRAAASTDSGVRIGGIGPNYGSDDGSFSAGIGLHGDERFEAHVWYGVDASGQLSVTVNGSDVAIPKAIAQSVTLACAR